jgi:hypothetical protein
MGLEMVCRVDFWCNRHFKASPVVLEGFWKQIWWKKIGRGPIQPDCLQAFRLDMRRSKTLDGELVAATE